MNSGAGRLYREAVLEHARRPVGRDASIDATHRAEGDNPLCGDRVEMLFRVDQGTVLAAAFRGQACAICIASASLLCRDLPGRPVSVVPAALAAFRSAVGAGEDDGDCPEPLRTLLPVAAYPARVDCAALPWVTAAAALEPQSDNET